MQLCQQSLQGALAAVRDVTVRVESASGQLPRWQHSAPDLCPSDEDTHVEGKGLLRGQPPGRTETTDQMAATYLGLRQERQGASDFAEGHLQLFRQHFQITCQLSSDKEQGTYGASCVHRQACRCLPLILWKRHREASLRRPGTSCLATAWCR